MLDILKNPVIIGLFATAVTYAYLLWAQQNDPKKKNKKGKKNTKKEDVNLLIPAVVGIIIWFVAYGYFEYSKEDANEQGLTRADLHAVASGDPKSYKLVRDGVSTPDSVKSFDLITKGINIPQKPLPDVFIETY